MLLSPEWPCQCFSFSRRQSFTGCSHEGLQSCNFCQLGINPLNTAGIYIYIYQDPNIQIDSWRLIKVGEPKQKISTCFKISGYPHCPRCTRNVFEPPIPNARPTTTAATGRLSSREAGPKGGVKRWAPPRPGWETTNSDWWVERNKHVLRSLWWCKYVSTAFFEYWSSGDLLANLAVMPHVLTKNRWPMEPQSTSEALQTTGRCQKWYPPKQS